MAMKNEPHRTVLCGANAYDKNYYFNEQFSALPAAIREELQVLCVLFTEEVGGVFLIGFEDDGSVFLETESSKSDYYYDAISSGLMVGEVRNKRQELFVSLELYYQVFFGGMIEESI
jgi:hypothetical protein